MHWQPGMIVSLPFCPMSAGIGSNPRPNSPNLNGWLPFPVQHNIPCFFNFFICIVLSLFCTVLSSSPGRPEGVWSVLLPHPVTRLWTRARVSLSFPPGGVASTGLILNTQTNCSTTPAATVSKNQPHPSLYHLWLFSQHQTHLSPWLPPHTVISMAIIQLSATSHTCLHGYHLACWRPWLQTSTAPLNLSHTHQSSCLLFNCSFGVCRFKGIKRVFFYVCVCVSSSLSHFTIRWFHCGENRSLFCRPQVHLHVNVTQVIFLCEKFIVLVI